MYKAKDQSVVGIRLLAGTVVRSGASDFVINSRKGLVDSDGLVNFFAESETASAKS